MEPDLWRRVKEVCQRALEADESRRSEFLERCCGDDQVLRREVEAFKLGSPVETLGWGRERNDWRANQSRKPVHDS
jgi:hypothetical protein